MALVELQGSPKQVAWAEKIRINALTTQAFDPQDYAMFEKVVDSTWFIANVTVGNKLVPNFKAPLPHQLVGGPPPPPKSSPAPTSGQPDTRAVTTAYGFAKSVSLNPALAEITILALLSRLYKNDTASQLRGVALDLLEGFQQEVEEKMRKDIEGIGRILGQG